MSTQTPPKRSRPTSAPRTRPSSSSPSPKPTKATSTTPKKSTSTTKPSPVKKNPITPAKSKKSVQEDSASDEDHLDEPVPPQKKTAKKSSNSPAKESTRAKSPARSKTTTTTPSKRQGLISTSVSQPVISLTRTPRKYPLLNKDIDVSDQYVGKNGQISVDELVKRSHSAAKSTPRRAATPAQSQQQPFIPVISGQELYHRHQQSSDQPQNGGESLLLRAFILLVLFSAAIAAIWTLYGAMPPIDPVDKIHIKLPRSVEEAKSLSLVVDKYKELYPTYVFALFAATYIFLQAFAIPGAVFLSVLAGPIWGVAKGMVIISLVATTGSSLCFLISKTIARPIFERFFPTRIQQFKAQLEENHDNLFFYLLFLRIAPVFPNWLISVSSPIIDVPYIHFAVATFIGIMPNNYIMTTVGTGLQNMTNSSKLMTPQSIASLFVISLLAVFPIVLKKIVGKKNQ